MTPNHFSGFSKQELVTEVKEGMKLFKESTVTNIENSIKKLSSREIRDSPEKVISTLEKSLSSHPIIQLAQLNEIYTRVNEGKVPIGGAPGWIQKKSSSVSNVKTLLQNLYETKATEIKNSLHTADAGHQKLAVKSSDILGEITQRHQIFSDLSASKGSTHSDVHSSTIKSFSK